MPVKTAKKTINNARRTISEHWSRSERRRRREMADLMQRRLAMALVGRDAPVAS